MKKAVLELLAVVGALLTALAGLSGLVMYLFDSGRPVVDDPTIVWFAPLFLTPLALVGIAMMLISALVAKERRALLGWSCLAFAVVLALTVGVFSLTGLSTGEIELEGTLWGTTAIVLSLLYALGMLGMSAVGVLVANAIHGGEPTHRAHMTPA